MNPLKAAIHFNANFSLQRPLLMLKKERQALILREVTIHKKVAHTSLSEKMNVSEDTIRRDLQELAEQGQLIKVRGGALSKSFHEIAYQEQNLYANKEITFIAQKAVSLLQNDMHIFIAGGMVNVEFARIIPQELNATIYTNSVPVAGELVKHQNSEIIFVGGRISKNEKMTIGGDVIQFLNQIQPDLCCLCTNGLDVEKGFTDSDWEIVNAKKAMIQRSSKIAVLTGSEMLGVVQKIQIAEIGVVNYLITELSESSEILSPFSQKGVKVI